MSRLTVTAPDGSVLPLLDIRDPAFEVPRSEADVAALIDEALVTAQHRPLRQRLVLRLFSRVLARQSRLIAALGTVRKAGYLDGVSTYVLKLGPHNLPSPYNSDLDRTVAGTPAVTSMRVRLDQLARLLADTLRPALDERPQAPLVLLDIGGGPCLDAINALLLLDDDGALAGRRVRILVYDLDDKGPELGRAILAELRQDGAFSGCQIELVSRSGSWSDLDGLRRALAGIDDEAIVAASSEGALFEYGTDDDITGVLNVLAPRVPFVLGSVTRSDGLSKLLGAVRVTRPRGLERFAELIASTGYLVLSSKPAPLSDQVVLGRWPQA